MIADALETMSVWAWVAVGVTGFLGIGLVVGLAVATILGRIAEDFLRLVEQEQWASAPLTRECALTDDLATRRRSRRSGSTRARS